MLPATVDTIAAFGTGAFLENLAVRRDDSILVTSLHAKQLCFVPPPTPGIPRTPVVLHTFDHVVTAVVETDPDVFHVAITDAYATHASHLARVDLRGWEPGAAAPPVGTVLTFDGRARALNGGCLLAPNVLLLADSFAGLIWRVDLPTPDRGPSAEIWLAHASMHHDPRGELTPPQPGINGLRYAASTNHVYYTCTAQKLFLRVAVNPDTYGPMGEPEYVGGGRMADDFCLDENAGMAYLTTHRENTIDRVPLDPHSMQPSRPVAGDPLDTDLLGPSSIAWGRRPGEHGHVAYVTTDGGRTAPPPDGIVRPATLLRLTLP